MFEVNMDEYLDEEVEYLKLVFDNMQKLGTTGTHYMFIPVHLY